METQSVISPIGSESVPLKNLAKRLDTLNGKTVCEVWNEDFKGDIMFPIYREMLKERFPGVKIVPYTEFPHTHVSDNATKQRERATLIANLAKEKGCDAMLSGNGA